MAPNLLQRVLIRPAGEADHRFQRYFHLESGSPGALPAGFDSGILGDGGGNGVREFSGQPVHDVVHFRTSSAPPELGYPGRLPSTYCLRGRWQDSSDKVVHMKDLELGN